MVILCNFAEGMYHPYSAQRSFDSSNQIEPKISSVHVDATEFRLMPCFRHSRNSLASCSRFACASPSVALALLVLCLKLDLLDRLRLGILLTLQNMHRAKEDRPGEGFLF